MIDAVLLSRGERLVIICVYATGCLFSNPSLFQSRMCNSIKSTFTKDQVKTQKKKGGNSTSKRHMHNPRRSLRELPPTAIITIPKNHHSTDQASTPHSSQHNFSLASAQAAKMPLLYDKFFTIHSNGLLAPAKVLAKHLPGPQLPRTNDDAG